MKNQELSEGKEILRTFMREHYTDERLAMLLEHAQSGRLRFLSCCCFIGVATADHYIAARRLSGADDAERAYGHLATTIYDPERDAQRCLRLIPIIRAEMRRRDRLARKAENLAEVAIA
jgi:predicted protein tyrosine phosphatase